MFRESRISSFAHDLMFAGVSTVVAMKYNVYVSSATRYVEEFYRQLGRSQRLSVAASLARKHLASDERRALPAQTVLDDWMVPVVFQSGEDLAFRQDTAPKKDGSQDFQVNRAISSPLPPPPDLGHIGSDDALLAIDRAFDTDRVVLLYGLAGSGKTAAAVEFGRWYEATGGVAGEILFSSFEHPRRLEQLVTSLEPLIRKRVALAEWSQMNTIQRAQAAVGVLSATSVLWIWDNVETVQRLPRAQQQLLLTFLKEASSAGVRFLLTSRDQQREWLAHLPAFVQMPPLRFSESVEFARRMLGRFGYREPDLEILVPMLTYAQGNPLVLSIALSTLLSSTDPLDSGSVASFISQLEAGEAILDDDPRQGKSRSLAASLQYGFERAFSNLALSRLAVLYLFRSYVNVWVLVAMGRTPDDPSKLGLIDYDATWALRELAGQSPRMVEDLLVKAMRLGLLARSGENEFWMHPAIQLHLKGYFDRFYSIAADSDRVKQAFAESIGLYGIQFTIAYSHGARERVIRALADEEDNLVHALELSHGAGWWQSEIGVLHGLFTLYEHRGRLAEWAEVFGNVAWDFLDEQLRPLGAERSGGRSSRITSYGSRITGRILTALSFWHARL